MNNALFHSSASQMQKRSYALRFLLSSVVKELKRQVEAHRQAGSPHLPNMHTMYPSSGTRQAGGLINDLQAVVKLKRN